MRQHRRVTPLVLDAALISPASNWIMLMPNRSASAINKSSPMFPYSTLRSPERERKDASSTVIIDTNFSDWWLLRRPGKSNISLYIYIIIYQDNISYLIQLCFSVCLSRCPPGFFLFFFLLKLLFNVSLLTWSTHYYVLINLLHLFNLYSGQIYDNTGT